MLGERGRGYKVAAWLESRRRDNNRVQQAAPPNTYRRKRSYGTGTCPTAKTVGQIPWRGLGRPDVRLTVLIKDAFLPSELHRASDTLTFIKPESGQHRGGAASRQTRHLNPMPSRRNYRNSTWRDVMAIFDRIAIASTALSESVEDCPVNKRQGRSWMIIVDHSAQQRTNAATFRTMDSERINHFSVVNIPPIPTAFMINTSLTRFMDFLNLVFALDPNGKTTQPTNRQFNHLRPPQTPTQPTLESSGVTTEHSAIPRIGAITAHFHFHYSVKALSSHFNHRSICLLTRSFIQVLKPIVVNHLPDGHEREACQAHSETMGSI
ncbi:hypothetical protein V8E52_005174 [Russula decolorans]